MVKLRMAASAPIFFCAHGRMNATLKGDTDADVMSNGGGEDIYRMDETA